MLATCWEAYSQYIATYIAIQPQSHITINCSHLPELVLQVSRQTRQYRNDQITGMAKCVQLANAMLNSVLIHTTEALHASIYTTYTVLLHMSFPNEEILLFIVVTHVYNNAAIELSI